MALDDTATLPTVSIPTLTCTVAWLSLLVLPLKGLDFHPHEYTTSTSYITVDIDPHPLSL
jgi:hypothetical protein